MEVRKERYFTSKNIIIDSAIKFFVAIVIAFFSAATFNTYAYAKLDKVSEQVKVIPKDNSKFGLTDATINGYFLFNHHVIIAIKSTYKNEEEMNKDKDFAKLDAMCCTLLGFKDILLNELKILESSSNEDIIGAARRFYRIVQKFENMKKVFDTSLKDFAYRKLKGSLKTFIKDAYSLYDECFSDFVETFKTDLRNNR